MSPTPGGATAAFFDSNVLLYLLSRDQARAARAQELLAQGGHLSVQVLNECAHVARRKAGLGWDEIGDWLAIVRRFCRVHALTERTHDEARALAARYGLGLYDAAIVAAATQAGCTRLWTEDLQHGQLFPGGLRVLNPFLAQVPLR